MLSISGVSIGSRRFLDGYYVLAISSERDAFEIASALEKTGLFDVLEFDAYGTWNATPHDPNFSLQWNLPKISMPQGWDIITGNSSVILSIIDSGTRYTHEDLDGNLWVDPAEDRNGNGKPDFYAYAQGGDLDGIDNDGNGFVDDLIGWDFYESDNNPNDAFGHGTNVAGISSAQTDNYESGSYRGIAGVAGGWGSQKGVSLMVLRMGNSSPIASLTNQAIEYAASNGARVINISSGFYPEPSGMADAINLAVNTYGVVIVASAGNNGESPDPSISYPAKYSNTIAVGATDQNDNRRSYSSHGPEMFVVAPDGVPSTTMAGGYVNEVSGTSFAAPHVAGLAALIRSINPSLTWQQVRSTLQNSADKVAGMQGQYFHNQYGYGRINANNAVRNLYVPQVYSTISAALSAAISGQTVRVSSSQTLTGNLTVPSGVTLTISSGVNINLNTYSIICQGTGKIVKNGTISNYSCYVMAGSDYKAFYPSSLNTDISVPTGQALTCAANTTLNGRYISSTGGTITINGGVYVTPNIQIKQSGTLKALYPTLQSAVNASTTSQIVELFSTLLLDTDTSIPSGKTLVHKSGSTLNMNGKKVTTTSGTLTVESGATINPDVRMRASSTVKGLYPTIQSALNAQASGQHVKLAARSYMENLSMKTGSYLLGEGRTQTTLYGTVTFSNVNSAWLEKLTVQQAITIQGGNGNWIDNVGACNIIDIDNGVNHQVYETTTLYNGYIDTYCNDPVIEALTSTNTKSYGVVGYGSDPEISSGTFEHKNKAIFCSNYMHPDIDNVKFCAQSGSSDYDIYASATSSANVTVGSGTFSKCPFPNSFYGNVTVSGSCVYCGRLSKTLADGESVVPDEESANSTGVNSSSPAAAEYRRIKDAYNLIRANLRKERRADRFASAGKYAVDYQKVIDSALQFVDAYPDSPEASKILRLIAYSYRSLNQHEKIMAVADEVIKSHPQLTAAALQVEIPYLLEVNRFDEAMQAMDQVVGLAKDTEERQAVLYQKAKMLLNYMKSESAALAVFNQLISLDPQSDTALLAAERVDNIKGNPKPAPQMDSEEEQLEFSVVNYPNPANPGTTIKYTLPEEGRVVVAVFNIVGRRVTELENTFMPKGSHVVYWDGRDQAGNPSATGLYFYRIQFDDKMLTNKFLLVK